MKKKLINIKRNRIKYVDISYLQTLDVETPKGNVVGAEAAVKQSWVEEMLMYFIIHAMPDNAMMMWMMLMKSYVCLCLYKICCFDF